jgi:hypothetical protein
MIPTTTRRGTRRSRMLRERAEERQDSSLETEFPVSSDTNFLRSGLLGKVRIRASASAMPSSITISRDAPIGATARKQRLKRILILHHHYRDNADGSAWRTRVSCPTLLFSRQITWGRLAPPPRANDLRSTTALTFPRSSPPDTLPAPASACRF